MSRTTRNINYQVFGETKAEVYRRYKEMESAGYKSAFFYKRHYLLYGTDAVNYKYHNKEYFNRAHRAGRADAKAQLRPHYVLEEDYDFDPSTYTRKYKGVWWDIY